MQTFILNIVSCVVFKIIITLLMPEGQMKKFSLSAVSLMLFYSFVYPIIQFINTL